MTPDTILTLADFEFDRAEIPESINFGGTQRLAIHELVGGVRVIDAMGRSDAPITWSGIFTGSNADQRARYIDGLRIAGKSVQLTWGGFIYEVVISEFNAVYERFYRVPYRITCTVVRDQTTPTTEIADQGMDGLIILDMDEATALGDDIGDDQLSGLLGTLDSAIKTVSDFANATTSTINSVLAPLAAVQARVKILIGSVGGVLGTVSTVGGVLPNNPISRQVNSVLSQVAAGIQLPKLYDLQSILGRMGGNLGSIGSSGRSVTVAGGNLMSMAASEYGDATAWTAIARANNLTDPLISGVRTLTIPQNKDSTDGLLNA